MTTTAFLAALPALLAVAAFVIFHLIGHQNNAQAITKEIISKLRKESPDSASKLEGLPPRQVAAKLKWDHELRTAVSTQDFDLLTRVSQHEFIKSIIVYSLIALLFIVGVGAFVYVQTRPKPVDLSDWHLESTSSEARGLAVDVDELRLSWRADGPDEDISVSLENIETKRRTVAKSVSSAQQYIIFPADSYREILANRARGTTNRIRAIARTRQGVSISNEFVLFVGINVTAIPVVQDHAIWVAALIDNSSIPFYHFSAKLIIWPKTGAKEPLSYGDEMGNPKTVFYIPKLSEFDLSSVKIAYFGPDDPRIVRTGLLGR